MTATVEYDSAGKLAEKVLKVLEERGWTRQDVEDCDGKVCLIGAVGLAYGEQPTNGYDLCDADDRPEALTDLVSGVTAYARSNYAHFPQFSGSGVSLYTFNDTYASDVTAVELALEYVIEREKQSV